MKGNGIIIAFLLLCGCTHHHSKAAFYDKKFITQPSSLAGTTYPSTIQSNWWNQFQDATLNHLIETALIDSPNLQIAQNRIQRADYIVQAASAPLWPSMNLRGITQRQRFASLGLVPPPFNGKIFNTTTLGLSFKYEFDFFGKNRQEIAAQVSQKLALEADLAEAKLVISTAVANRYYLLRYQQKLLAIDQQILKLKKTIHQILNAQYQQGLLSDLTLNNSKEEVTVANLTESISKTNVKQSQHQLLALLGKNALTTTIKTAPFVYQEDLLILPKMLPMSLIAQRPDLIAARLRAQAAMHSLKATQLKLLPNINLLSFLGYQSIKFDQLLEKTNQNNLIAGVLDLPLFDAGLRQANINISSVNYDSAVNEYNQTLIHALQETADQLSHIDSAKAKIKLHNEIFFLTKNRYQLTKIRYDRGIDDYLSLAKIKINYLKQEKVKLQYQYLHMTGTIGLIKALGGNFYQRKDVHA